VGTIVVRWPDSWLNLLSDDPAHHVSDFTISADDLLFFASVSRGDVTSAAFVANSTPPPRSAIFRCPDDSLVTADITSDSNWSTAVRTSLPRSSYTWQLAGKTEAAGEKWASCVPTTTSAAIAITAIENRIVLHLREGTIILINKPLRQTAFYSDVYCDTYIMVLRWYGNSLYLVYNIIMIVWRRLYRVMRRIQCRREEEFLGDWNRIQWCQKFSSRRVPILPSDLFQNFCTNQYIMPVVHYMLRLKGRISVGYPMLVWNWSESTIFNRNRRRNEFYPCVIGVIRNYYNRYDFKMDTSV